MSLLDTLKKNLAPEVLSAVQEALGDDFDYDMVPRTRLNKVINQRNQARKELSDLLDNDDEGNQGSGAGHQGGEPNGKTFTQADIDAAVQAANSQHSTEMKNLRIQFAATEMLRSANVIDPQMVLDAHLIDFSKVTTDESGKITGGMQEQIDSMKENKAFLFNAGNVQRGTGKTGGSNDFGTVTSKDDFLKLPLDKQIEFKNANPEVFKGFLNS